MLVVLSDNIGCSKFIIKIVTKSLVQTWVIEFYAIIDVNFKRRFVS